MRFLKLSYLQEQLVLVLECLLVVATGGGGGHFRKFGICVYRRGLRGLLLTPTLKHQRVPEFSQGSLSIIIFSLAPLSQLPDGKRIA